MPTLTKIKEAIPSTPVVMVSKSYCPFCRKAKVTIFREEVRNSILGYPSLKNKNFGTFLGEIHRINPEILGYPRIPGYPLTTSLHKFMQHFCHISIKFQFNYRNLSNVPKNDCRGLASEILILWEKGYL